MDSTTLSVSTILALSKTLNSSRNLLLTHLHRHFFSTRLTRPAQAQSLRTRFLTSQLRRISNGSNFGGLAPSSSQTSLIRPRLGCISASFGSGGGGFSSGGGGGGGDGGGSGDGKGNATGAEVDDLSAWSPDVIILDVGGMTCGGCAASVKRILENQPQVSSASVNLTTETAIVWPVSEAKVVPNWQKELGETLAKHLTTCGFKSSLRGQGAIEGETT
ncbi:Heavy metal-associated domain, HMA [Dillenia turbinata]|uniref:Heavy metal-associated domain, HMA n=1 Tax=Dillenia turbinata TaxID=194707 RepID=A0AAN8UVD1_9MAGN